ncbi:DUF397 domain-containing protein [Streptomyces sp. NBC_01451]
MVGGRRPRPRSAAADGDGDSCVEMADHRARVAVRDSKDPAHGTLSFPTGAFTRFVGSVKSPTRKPTSAP